MSIDATEFLLQFIMSFCFSRSMIYYNMRNIYLYFHLHTQFVNKFNFCYIFSLFLLLCFSPGIGFSIRLNKFSNYEDLKTGNIAYPCTGSIISRRVILTAAHCALAKAEGHRLWVFILFSCFRAINLFLIFYYFSIFNIVFHRTSVRLGEYDTSIDPDCSQSGFCAPTVINHMISHVIIHPDYKAGQYHHDIALAVLKTPLNYTGKSIRQWKNDLSFMKKKK